MSEDYVIIKRKVKRSWLIDILYRPPTRTEVLAIYSPKDLVNVVLRHILWYYHKRGNFDLFLRARDRHKALGLKETPWALPLEWGEEDYHGTILKYMLKPGSRIQIFKMGGKRPKFRDEQLEKVAENDDVKRTLSHIRERAQDADEDELWVLLANGMTALAGALEAWNRSDLPIYFPDWIPEELADWILEKAREEGAILEEPAPSRVAEGAVEGAAVVGIPAGWGGFLPGVYRFEAIVGEDVDGKCASAIYPLGCVVGS